MKIYTKAGDKGQTSLIGGRRVPKCHDRIEAYGTVDELIAYTGLLRDLLTDTGHNEKLIMIQDHLMTSASILAAEDHDARKTLPSLNEDSIRFLENEIDTMDSKLPLLNSFILPGGNPVISFCHIARTVCRRAERRVVKIELISEEEELVVRYLNRLSDYFFVLSRLISNELGINEIHWKPLL